VLKITCSYHYSIQLRHFKKFLRVFELFYIIAEELLTVCGCLFPVIFPDIANRYDTQVLVFFRHFYHSLVTGASGTTTKESDIYTIVCTDDPVIGDGTLCRFKGNCSTGHPGSSFAYEFPA